MATVRPTVRDVAALAGVSPMTVSRTLAGGVNVRADVQRKVLEAAERLGYRRDENARSLRPGQRTGLVGVAIADLANPYYGTLALGIEEEAERHGRRIVLGNTGEDPEREHRLVADLLGRRAEGLVVVPADGDYAHLTRAAAYGVPVVLAARQLPGAGLDAVLVDDVGGAYAGTIALLDEGHRRIAFLGNPASTFTGPRRLAGFRTAMAERGLDAGERTVVLRAHDVASARAAARQLLERADPPTAIVSSNNRITVGTLLELGELLRHGEPRERLPTLMAFDDFELAELMPIPILIADHDPRQLGRAAAALLFRRLLDPEVPADPTLVELPVRIRRISPAR